MLYDVPEKIRDKFHYSRDGGYLDEPYSAEEKQVCDEFLLKMKDAEKDTIIVKD